MSPKVYLLVIRSARRVVLHLNLEHSFSDVDLRDQKVTHVISDSIGQLRLRDAPKVNKTTGDMNR